MEKLSSQSPDLAEENVEKLAELFPSIASETLDEEGNTVRAIDLDLLSQELSGRLVDGPQERYRLDWPGKREALLTSNAPIAKALRPTRSESVKFDETRNLFIEGDNLDALKLLQESYLGEVKAIYVDPPYNTGNDFLYADRFATTREEELRRSGQVSEEGIPLVTNTSANGRFHSDWLSMIYPRLKVARNLLADAGVVMVSIDESEHANLVNVGIEIFGRDSYVGEIVIKNSSRNDQSYISVQHEYLVFFVKSKLANPGKWIERKGGLESIYAAFEGFRKKHGDNWEAIHKDAKAWFRQFAPADPEYASKHYTRMDEVGIFFADNISGPNDGQYEYEVIHPVTGKPCKMPSRGWVYPEESMMKKIEEGKVHFGVDETTVPNVKTYLKDTEYQSLTSIRFVDGRAASNRLRDLFGKKVFTNPKDELMLRDIFRAVGVSGEDLVLDLFSGSGSAAHAVLELNRDTGSAARFIGIQVAEDLHETLKTARGAAQKTTRNAIELLEGLGVPATVAEIAKQRLRLAGEQFDGSAVDVGFRVLKVDETSMADVLRTPENLGQADLALFVERVKADRSAEDLLFEVLLDWGLELTMPVAVEDFAGHEVHVVEDGALIACLEEKVDDDLVMSVAKRKPLRALFRDSSFATDADRINAEQIFAEVSSATDVRTI